MMQKWILTVVLGCCLAGCGKAQKDCTYCPEAVNQTYIHKYGMEVQKGEWSKRGHNGQVVSTLKTGETVKKNFRGGELDGDTTYSFPYSQAVQRIETYDNGVLVKEVENYLSGSPRNEINYLTATERQITGWYDNGTPRFKEMYRDDRLASGEYFNLHNQMESGVQGGFGKRINRDEFGLIVSEDTIDGGELLVKTTFYPNQAPKEVIPYSRGTIHGKKHTFYPDGEPQTAEEWRDGVQEGITVVFENGEKVAEVPYVNGKREGIEERFRDGQFMVEEVTWKNGTKCGPCYRHIGDNTVIDWYHDGKQVSKADYDRLTKDRFR